MCAFCPTPVLMSSLSPEIKHLLKTKKLTVRGNNVNSCVAECENRSRQQMKSYLTLVFSRLTENNCVHDEISKQEQLVANFLKLIQDNQTQHTLITDFDDLE